MTTLMIPGSIAVMLVLLGLLCYRNQQQQIKELQIKGLETTCTLLSLMKAIQQHRGVSSGILGGKTDQMSKLKQLSAQADAEVERISAQLENNHHPRWKSIVPKWKQIQIRWQQWDVLENFEQHCEVLRDIQALLQDVTDDSGLTSSCQPGQQRLAGQIFNQLPELIENIGQLRALSTHAAARHDCITAFRLHLQFLMEQLNAQNSRLLEQQDSAHQRLVSDISSLVHLVQHEILEAEKISVDPDKLFQNATAVMENCFETIDRGVNQFKQNQLA